MAVHHSLRKKAAHYLTLPEQLVMERDIRKDILYAVKDEDGKIQLLKLLHGLLKFLFVVFFFPQKPGILRLGLYRFLRTSDPCLTGRFLFEGALFGRESLVFRFGVGVCELRKLLDLGGLGFRLRRGKLLPVQSAIIHGLHLSKEIAQRTEHVLECLITEPVLLQLRQDRFIVL